MNKPTPKRYQWSWKGVSFDFYRLCEILNLKSEPQKHAIKKLIRAGQSIKTLEEDVDEAIAALERWKEMEKEDCEYTESQIADKLEKELKS